MEWHPIGVDAAIASERNERGKWKSREYFSTHSPASDRLRMHIKKSSKGKFFFAYNSNSEHQLDRLGGGEGESLTHYLYKIAISEL